MTAPADLAHLDPRQRIEWLRRAIAAVPGRTRDAAPDLFGPNTTEPGAPDDAATAPTSAASDLGDIVDDDTTRGDRLTASETAGDVSVDPTPSAPVSAHRTLPAPAALAELLPHRGLRRGAVTAISGAESLLLALIAGATAAGGHAAVVGHPRLSLLAAHEMGANLTRCAWIPDAGTDPVDVAAVLLDGLDLVVLDLAGATVAPTRARAVTARARSKNAALVITGGTWPGVEATVDAAVAGYTGLGTGHGRITGIRLDVTAAGRGTRPRSGRVEVTGRDGSLAWSTRTDPAGTGAQAAPMRYAL